MVEMVMLINIYNLFSILLYRHKNFRGLVFCELNNETYIDFGGIERYFPSLTSLTRIQGKLLMRRYQKQKQKNPKNPPQKFPLIYELRPN